MRDGASTLNPLSALLLNVLITTFSVSPVTLLSFFLFDVSISITSFDNKKGSDSNVNGLNDDVI